MYKYNAQVVSVYDGDSITVDIDLGFGIIYKNQKIRLADINAPEIRGEEREAGLISRDALRKKILFKNVILLTQKDRKGKYGRYIGTIEVIETTDILNEDGYPDAIDVQQININDWLVENGFAKKVLY